MGPELRRQGVLPQAQGRQGGHSKCGHSVHRRKVTGRRRRQGRGKEMNL